MRHHIVRGMIVGGLVSAMALGMISVPAFAITTPTPQPSPTALNSPTPLPPPTHTPTAFIPTADPLMMDATHTVEAVTAEQTATALVPTVDPLLIDITQTIQAVTNVFVTQTAAAVHSITPNFTSTPSPMAATATRSGPTLDPIVSGITKTLAAATNDAETRTAQPSLVQPTSQATPTPPAETGGNGGQTLLVAVLIALGLIVIAFSQATRRR